MSYCRFGDGDVYVFLSVNGYLDCCGCRLGTGDSLHESTDSMIAHLRRHIDAGHDVPVDVIPELERDRVGNDPWLAEAKAKRVGS